MTAVILSARENEERKKNRLRDRGEIRGKERDRWGREKKEVGKKKEKIWRKIR